MLFQLFLSCLIGVIVGFIGALAFHEFGQEWLKIRTGRPIYKFQKTIWKYLQNFVSDFSKNGFAAHVHLGVPEDGFDFILEIPSNRTLILVEIKHSIRWRHPTTRIVSETLLSLKKALDDFESDEAREILQTKAFVVVKGKFHLKYQGLNGHPWGEHDERIKFVEGDHFPEELGTLLLT